MRYQIPYLRTRLAGLLPKAAAIAFTALCSAQVSAYDFPIQDRWVATIVGTPEAYKAKVTPTILKNDSMVIFEDREIPDRLFYETGLRYSYKMQSGPAPAIFLIAGTGAGHNSAKNTAMARTFYEHGYHVICISSPTYSNFVATASSTAVPGHAEVDAEDLYRVMEKIWAKVSTGKKTATSFALAGYSLGGFNSAYVAKLDETRKSFNFRKVLLINPPVSLYSSISQLDRMSENIPGGNDNFPQFFNYLVSGLGTIYKEAKSSDFSDDFLYKAYEALDLKNEQLAALVGVSFRLSVADLTFYSDVMTNYGYVKPASVRLDRYESVGTYQSILTRLGFTDYFHEFFYPFYKAKDPSLERDALIQDMSLTAIKDYLQSAEKIMVMHNANDIILAPGEIDFFPEVFGSRATIYPYGGHCGNMEYTENVAHMVAAIDGTQTEVQP